MKYSSNIPEYSVSEVSDIVRNLLEENLSYIKIRGEISNLKYYPSGHVYFNLKDEESVINSVCFRNVAQNLEFKLEEGQEVVLTGKVSSYKARSNYQIIVTAVETAGIGALLEMLEKRKKQLQAEGLFDPAHKKPIPKIPTRIGIITSEAGAVYHDIQHRISDRFPCHIIFIPTPVQGKGAELQIANSINAFNEITDQNLIPDVIIVARGGGSIEDLWCFNEEIVARTVFNSKIPIISAVGHETDTTLIDFVSDLRAPTPTAAAELATPNKLDLIEKINFLNNKALSKINNQINSITEKLNLLKVKEPETILNMHYQNLDNKYENLSQKAKNAIEQLNSKLNSLSLTHPKTSIENLESKFNNLIQTFKKLPAQLIEKKQDKLINLSKTLEHLSYKNTLKRGYAVIRNNKQKLITTSKIPSNTTLEAEFYDGKVNLKT